MVTPSVIRFKGLNNVSDPLSMGMEWLERADNVDVTDAGKLTRRTGYSRALAGAMRSAYATIDQSRMYVIDGSALKAMAGTASAQTLRTGLATAPFSWTEINDLVFFSNGVDSGIIAPDNSLLAWDWQAPHAPGLLAVAGSLPAGQYQVACTFTLPDGRMTGSSEAVTIDLVDGQALQISDIPQAAGCTTNVFIAPANSTVFGLAAARAPAAMVWNAPADDLGRELTTLNLSPLPPGCDVIGIWNGRICAAQYFPELDQSAVYLSEPLGFHLFDLDSEGFMVPSRVRMLAAQGQSLVVGTDTAIHAYSKDGLTKLAPYGVVPGQHWSLDDDETILFWSTRGVCRALPFSNLTQQNVSVAPGLRAGGAIVRRGGQKRFLVAIQQGGSAFNQH